MKRIDHLMQRLVRLKQLGECFTQLIDLIQVSTSFEQGLDGSSWTRIDLGQ